MTHSAGRVRRSLAHGAAWNLAGFLLPVAVAVVCIPPLSRGLGVERFGLLTIAWAVVGYFSVFDLGIARALTHRLATLGDGGDPREGRVAWTGLAMLFAAGLVGGALLALIAGPLVRDVLRTPAPLVDETVNAFVLLGLAVPMITVMAGLRGILEARFAFRAVNLVRMPLGVLTFLAPLAVLPWTSRLDAVVAALVAARLVLLWPTARLAAQVLPALRRPRGPEAAEIRPLLGFGAWMTVSNVVSPIMTNLDRVMLGALLGIGVVAFYATPQEVVTKLALLPSAIVGVLFPAFAERADRAAALYARGMRYTLVMTLPPALAAIVFPHELLSAWLGPEFARGGAEALRWLALGVLVNCLGYVSFALVQGRGRADLTGKLHLAELPLYLAAFWVLTQAFGLVGAALAWLLRVTVDAAALDWLGRRHIGAAKLEGGTILLAWVAVCAAVAAGLALTPQPVPAIARMALFLTLLAAFLATAWQAIFDAADRARLRVWWVRARGSVSR
jgi:O-antigen/teichoic acid export membrane protein